MQELSGGRGRMVSASQQKLVKIMNQHFCETKTAAPLRERHNSSSKNGKFRSMESMKLLSVVLL